MAGVEVAMQAAFRDEMGRFIAAVENAARATIEDLVDEAADAGRNAAPTGKKQDPRSKSIKDSMQGVAISRTQGKVINTARHAAALYHGSRAHTQSGNVSFDWEAKGRRFIPGSNLINHPVTGAQPAFMDVAMQYMKRSFAEIARRWYPG